MEPCKVVAEISTVHLAKMDRAKDLINLAQVCGADYVKFQKRNPIESTPKNLWHLAHPDPCCAWGSTYLEHRQQLELDICQHAELKAYCESRSIGYACSVWDITSAKEIASLNPEYIKIGSPSNQNREMIRYLIDNYSGNLHVSLGMVSIPEREEILKFLMESVSLNRMVVYHCTSEYPCPFEHLYLEEILRLRMSLPAEVTVGFSNHGYGIAMDPIAYVLGAEWIERHFVDDRALRHTDASLSLEPHGLRSLCRNLRAARESVTVKNEMSKEEQEQRNKLKRDDNSSDGDDLFQEILDKSRKYDFVSKKAGKVEND